MQQLFTLTTDKLQLVTSSTSAIDVMVTFLDMSQADPPVVKGSTSGRQATAITTASPTDIMAAPGASTSRGLKSMTARNKGAENNTLTVVMDLNGTDYELYKVTLRAEETLEYIEGVGFFVVPATALLDARLIAPADVVNATTSFADVTGLTVNVKSGKHYNFEAHLYHVNNASTTGSRFGINGPTMTALIAGTIDTVTPSVTASAHSAGVVAALNTAATAQTTGSTSQRLAILSGWINPSADGTFAIRCASEIAVAAGLTVKAGSWCRIWEPNA